MEPHEIKPYKIFDGERTKWFYVGCRACGQPFQGQLFRTEKGELMLECSACGHRIDIESKAPAKRRPD